MKKKTHDKITEYRVGCGKLTIMVTVTKKHSHFQNNLGSLHKGVFL